MDAVTWKWALGDDLDISNRSVSYSNKKVQLSSPPLTPITVTSSKVCIVDVTKPMFFSHVSAYPVKVEPIM